MMRFRFAALACAISLLLSQSLLSQSLLAQSLLAEQTKEPLVSFEGYLTQPNEYASQAVRYASDLSSGNCQTCNCYRSSCGCRHSCRPDICQRDYLLGDWLGLRSGLAQRGLIADIQWTHFYQGVVSGGNNQTSEYGGKVDYNLTLMGEKVGLWKGLVVTMHAETRHGNTIILDGVPLAPSNANMLYPSLANETAITSLLFTQMISPELALVAGKFNALDLFSLLYPQTGRGIDGFMNVSLIVPMTTGKTLPLSFNGAGVMKMRGQQIQGALLVYDSNNTTTTAGFDELFDNGANLAALWKFFTDYDGLPGSHMFLATYAHGTFTSLDANGWQFIPTVGVIPAESTGSWNFNYVLEQKLWSDCCNKNRSIGFMSQFGIADEETNIYQWTMSATLQSQGLFFGRDHDTMGIGYFYSGLSNDFKGLMETAEVSIDDLQGGEIYYNAALSPWFHLTYDLQIIQPSLTNNDTAVVAGLRANMKF